MGERFDLDLNNVRQESLRTMVRLGYPAPPPHFPLVDNELAARSSNDVVRRLAALSAVSAVAHGCPPSLAVQWLEAEGVIGALSRSEREYLGKEDHAATDDEAGRPEAIHALAWAVRLMPSLDFGQLCPESLVNEVPHPPGRYGPLGVATVAASASVRPVAELVAALDLAYCLHWAVADASLRSQPTPGHVPGWVVVERRRALEWLLTPGDWDDLSLDT